MISMVQIGCVYLCRSISNYTCIWFCLLLYLYLHLYTEYFSLPKTVSFWQALPQRTPVLHSLFPANVRPGFPYTDGFLDFVPLKVLQDFRIQLATRQDMFLQKAPAFGWKVDVHEVPRCNKTTPERSVDTLAVMFVSRMKIQAYQRHGLTYCWWAKKAAPV